MSQQVLMIASGSLIRRLCCRRYGVTRGDCSTKLRSLLSDVGAAWRSGRRPWLATLACLVTAAVSGEWRVRQSHEALVKVGDTYAGQPRCIAPKTPPGHHIDEIRRHVVEPTLVVVGLSDALYRKRKDRRLCRHGVPTGRVNDDCELVGRLNTELVLPQNHVWQEA
jgi:hypothetical protein